MPAVPRVVVDTNVWVSAVLVPPGNLRLCRDPDDDIVIETALVGRAVVTRDDDLKDDPEVVSFLGKFGIPVHPVRRFLATLSELA